MTVQIACPKCGHFDEVDWSFLGRDARCRSCAAVFRVMKAELKWRDVPAKLDSLIPSTDAGRVPSDNPIRPVADRMASGESEPTLSRPGSTASPKPSQFHSMVHAGLGFAAALLLVGMVFLARSVLGPGLALLSGASPRGSHPSAGSSGSRERTLESIIELGKKASALVEVTLPGGEVTGTAFCINPSGLFVTNAHVVADLFAAGGDLRLMLDIGQKTQRRVPAKVRRADDYLDLALLELRADPRLTSLELGNDRTLSETAPVVAFGFPLGEQLRYGREQYPNCTVISGRVTTFHGSRERLDGIQFDGQINPGQSGGPVLDDSGRVIGVATATVQGKSMNLAVPVGRLSEFLAAPGVSFHPPALPYSDRHRPVNWSIKLEPATSGAKVPEGLSVQVTIAHSKADRRTAEARRQPDGTYTVQVIPVPVEPFMPIRAIEALVEARKGTEVLATIHRVIALSGAPWTMTDNQRVAPEYYIVRILPRPPVFGFGPRVPRFGALRPGTSDFNRFRRRRP
jgi:S1-C subfamily serine protease